MLREDTAAVDPEELEWKARSQENTAYHSLIEFFRIVHNAGLDEGLVALDK